MKPLTISFLLIALLGAATADIPAHCLYNEVVGEWTFHHSPNPFLNNVNCEEVIKGPLESYRVTLQEPNVAVDEQGRKGTWTLIYDQGFEAIIGGQKWFGFFKYTQDAQGNVTSYCGETSPGWFHDEKPPMPGMPPLRWGCFKGEKAEKVIKTHSVEGVMDSDDLVKADPAFQKALESKASWEVGPNVFEGQSLRSVKKMLGGGRRIQSSLQSVKSVRSPRVQKDSSLPESFSWTSVDGALIPVRDQGQCGSCYTFATTEMLSARIRINRLRKGEQVPKTPSIFDPVVAMLSPQQVVSCNEYSQGCDGGFAYLVAKFGQDFGIASDFCFGYQSGLRVLENTEVPCEYVCPESQRYFIDEYHYVGGYFGNCSEEAMMEELVKDGPLAVAFEVTDDFMHYKGGIYKPVSGISKLSINPFEETNHAVLLTGYGVENGTPYWEVQNSWSTTWGEKGFFRIVRGENALAIESMAVGATPYVH